MEKIHRYFVTGIGTEVGKTVASAIVVQALNADYWKPVQSGLGFPTDSQKIETLAGSHGTIYPETYRLKAPLSPHASAAEEEIYIQLSAFELPDSKCLIVEGAGGLEVPLNNEHTMLDLIAQLKLPVIVVSRHYLGSINHSLLSIKALQARNIPIQLLIFIGDNQATEEIILKMSGVESFIKIPETDTIDVNFVHEQAKRIRPLL